MRLDIDISQKECVIQEPIRVLFRLTNDGDTPQPIPYSYDAGDIFTIHLYDANDEYVDSFDGYTQDMRLGLDHVPVDQATMATETMDAGDSFEWIANLCTYTDFDLPGKFGVEAEFVFHPSGISARSPRAQFEIKQSHVRWTDVLVDSVATPVLHTLQMHEDEDDSRLIFHFRSVEPPMKAWSGGCLISEAGIAPKISRADFQTRATFEHDFTRWLAWIDSSSQLSLICFREPYMSDEGWGELHTIALPSEDTRMLGRPIQHEGGGVSVVLSTPLGPDASRLEFQSYDTDGALQESRDLGQISAWGEDPVVMFMDSGGGIGLAYGRSGKLPVYLATIENGAVEEQEIISTQVLKNVPGKIPWPEFDILGMSFDYVGGQESMYVTAALALQEEDYLSLYLCRQGAVMGGEQGLEAYDLVRIPNEVLEGEEQIINVDLLTDSKANTRFLLATSAGRLLVGSSASPIQCLKEVSPDTAAMARFVRIGVDTHLFYIDEKFGLKHFPIKGL